MAQSVQDLLLRRFVPASLIVTERGDIAYIHGRTGRFLEPNPGEPRHNLFLMAREGLRSALQSVVRTAAREGREVIQRGVAMKTDRGTERVMLIVQRLEDPESLSGLFRVSLAIIPPAPRSKPAALARSRKTASKEQQYESELREVRASLHGTLDELQGSNEELRAANEELQSTNEEMQSANEELETSKEEMQSLNEELQTLNAELQLKVEELAQVNDDMQNLLNSTDIATIFLDRQLRIKRFTEQARHVVRLIATDVGRSIGDLVPEVRYDSLVEDAQGVLRTLKPHETEVQTLDGHWLFVRMLPYRTAQNLIDGVVVTFVDIDRLKRAELLEAPVALAESIVQTVREPLAVLDGSFRVLSTNQAFARLFGLGVHEIKGQLLFGLGGGILAGPRVHTLFETLQIDGQPVEAFDFNFESTAVGSRTVQLTVSRLDAAGANLARFVLAISEKDASLKAPLQ
jgi:two-component system CheB/CheR fusion protein